MDPTPAIVRRPHLPIRRPPESPLEGNFSATWLLLLLLLLELLKIGLGLKLLIPTYYVASFVFWLSVGSGGTQDCDGPVVSAMFLRGG